MTHDTAAREWVFDPPDALWKLLWALRDVRFRQEYWRWVRKGPNDTTDEAKFERQWQAAGPEGQPAVTQYYQDQRENRRTSLLHIKADVPMLFTQLGLLPVALATVVTISSPAKVQALLQSNSKLFLLLLPAAWVVASTSHSNKLLYAMRTHFIGAAEWGQDVTDQKSYTNSIRKEVNSLSRTLQRARRRLDLSRLLIIVLILFLVKLLLWG
ncbi:MAG TPA: hypothetical protein VFO38_02655 [Candidatus Saccharimonadales bacterium]|nr:hypothetical protein [Candidatus Saccharimonadales bacterium]